MNQANKLDIPEIVLEFFEISIHAILYIKKLYPETIFIPKKKYGIAVFQIIHPEVRDYIVQCLKAVSFHLKNGQLKKLLVNFENEEEVFEKVILDVLNFSKINDSDTFLVDLEQALRSFLLKLYSSQTYLSELPSDATFSIQIETTKVSSVEFNQQPSFETFPWVEVVARNSENNQINSSALVPLQTLDSQPIKIQMYIQKISKY